jgi:hypothetical protein
MKTINLNEESPSVAQLLAMARKKSLLLVSKDGSTFVLEEADDFDREIVELGSSERFMTFLSKRSKEPGATSIEELAKQLIEKAHSKPMQPTRSAAKPRRVPSARKKRSPRRG